MELANTYMAEEQFELAIPQLKRINSLVDKQDEMIPESMLKMGIALYNLDRTEEALDQYQVLISRYPSSSQASEALETSKGLLVELGKISEYEDFLKKSGRSLETIEKDSLFFQFVQKTNAQGTREAAVKAIQDYLTQFPNGLYSSEVLYLKAEQLSASKSWTEAAATYAVLASKGVSKYQERALRQGARIYFFELKEYEKALELFKQLASATTKSELIAEAQRGAIRCHYNLKDWESGKQMALELLSNSISNADDKSFAEIILAYSDQISKSYLSSTAYFTSVANRNNASLGAEARFQIASNYYQLKQLDQSEKAAMKCIEETGSYEYWVTQSYILLGDIFLSQKDYFNAKATLQSVVENCSIVSLREIAAQKLKSVENEERENKKL
jgi:tetratricopeptide (TPR) repeat protein